jgi:GNAT superfamily N-acetyltransferase
VDELTLRLIRTWALNVAAQATALAQTDPTWGSEAHPVGDGWLILWGQDMYVNRAMAVGISGAVSNDDINFIVSRCRRMGVQPAFEVTPSTLPATVERLERHGFVHDTSANVTALIRPLPGPPIDAPDDFVVRPVRSEADLALWQDVNATGWGHVDRRAREVSDAFATAAHVTDGDGMMIAFDTTGERPVGCASVTIRDRLATLGAMSTHPDHRRQGVQAALVRHRLSLAAQRGCDHAATTAATGGQSERNLRRHGFRPVFEIMTWKS